MSLFLYKVFKIYQLMLNTMIMHNEFLKGDTCLNLENNIVENNSHGTQHKNSKINRENIKKKC